MHPSLRSLLFVAAPTLFVAAMAACAAGGGASAAEPAPDAGADQDEPNTGPESLAFPTGNLRLSVGESRAIEILAHPPGPYRVTLALEGQSDTSSLDRGQVVTGTDGKARFVLTASSRAAAFTVRAAAGAASARLPVAVSAAGFGTVRVEPQYGGRREVGYWTATVHVGTRCSALLGTPPPDGPLRGVALGSSAPEVTGVPAGPPLAVTLRAAELAGGCTEAPPIAAGSIAPVTVVVQDRPLSLGRPLSLVLASADPTVLADAHDPTVERMAEALPAAENELSALLDAMQAEASARALDLSQAALRGDWLEVGRDVALATGAPTVREALRERLRAGVLASDAERLLVGTLERLAETPGRAHLRVLALLGEAPEAVGAPTEVAPVAWSADADDVVALGATLRWYPSLLAYTLAERGALREGAESLASALAGDVRCQELAGAFSAAAAVEGCDDGCLALLCESAVARLIAPTRLVSVLRADVARLELGISGAASVGDTAELRGWSGSWVGTLQLEGEQTRTGGLAAAEPAGEPPP